LVVGFDAWPRPGRVDIICRISTVTIVEGYEKRSLLRCEYVATENLWNQLGQVCVTCRQRTIVHIVASIGGQPHEVRSS